MKYLIFRLVELPLIGRFLLFFYRLVAPARYLLSRWRLVLLWLIRSKETTNYTYDLENKNKLYLASLIACILKTDINKVVQYIEELESDDDLRNHIRSVTHASKYSFMADSEVYYARRVAWYAITRILKPKVVIETGVDKGLGACVLTAALMKNPSENSIGYYFGTDINPKAGYLLTGKYSEFGKILYSDSLHTLKSFNQEVDLFINDSDHSAEYEFQEYETIKNKISKNGIILGDNAHATQELYKFSVISERNFVFFQEAPKNHWYPGAGIGISWK